MKRIKAFLKKDYAGIIIGGPLFLAALLCQLFEASTAAAVLFPIALVGAGYSVFISAVRGILRRDLLDEKFLMSIASIGAMVIGERAEGVAVMLFFLVGEFFEHRAVKRSRNSIRALMQIRPDTARVLIDGEECIEDAEDVEVGSVILIRPGERVPVDCRIFEGEAELDTSSMTGEAQPRAVRTGDEVMSGVVVLGGLIKAVTLRVAEDSAASRVLELVEEATERKSKEEAFITVFARIYTPIVTALALLMAALPPIFGLLTLEDALYRALSFLVVSCPCALVISVPMAFFGGIGGAAAEGVLFKGGNSFSPMSRLRAVVFDKTGTLTTGKFKIAYTECYGVSESELLLVAASCEYNSNHPIALSIKAAADAFSPVEEYEEIIGKGVRARIDGRTVLVGNSALMRENGIAAKIEEQNGLFVCRDGVLLGRIVLTDEMKPEAKDAIAALHALGVKKTYLLSGDRRENVLSAAGALGIDCAQYELSPSEKYTKLEEIIASEGGRVAYVGDGINDAPCLAGADVGVAMGALGQDSAVEASDVVLMSDSLSRLPTAIKKARKTLGIAKQNIIFSLFVKLLVILLVAFDLAGMPLAVFADVGVALIAILNSMRALK